MVKEIKVPVRNFMLLKHMREEDGIPFLVATFQQNLYNVNEEMGLDRDDTENAKFFEYRMNDVPANAENGWLSVRRTERNGSILTTTFQVDAPMALEVEFDRFPFKIARASIMIELSSFTTCNDGIRLRPNILLCRRERLMNLAIQTPEGFDSKGGDYSNIKAVDEKMDKCLNYDFITPLPKLDFLYDAKKEYCPKMHLSFGMVQSGGLKFVQIVLPICLIAVVNTMLVLDNAEITNSNFLVTASILALTFIIILPSITAGSTTQRLLTLKNVYSMLIFVGLALSTVRGPNVDTNIYAISGMFILWASFLIPISSATSFYLHSQKIRKESPNIHTRVLPHKVKRITIDADYKKEAILVEDIVKGNNGLSATLKEDFSEGGDDRVAVNYSQSTTKKFRLVHG